MKKLITLGILIAIIVLSIVITGRQVATGSVSQASEYIATTTINVTGGNGQGTPLTGTVVLNTGNGTLGSIIITGANTGTINFFDGTTTQAHSNHATTTLATIPASASAGTYTFDVRYVRGLIVEIIGTVATSTITFR